MMRRRLLTSSLFVAFAGIGCASHPEPAPSPQANANATATAAPTPLPAVTEPAASRKRPPWILELSPTNEAAIGAQIRIRFANDVVPVEMLEAPERQAALAKVEIAPKIPGHFIFVTPRMITFSAEAAVPTASRIVVTLHAGLADLKGNTLDHDLAYTFTTKEPVVTLSNPVDAPPQGARPRIDLQASVPLDVDSLAAHATLHAKDGTSIPLALETAPPVSASATPERSTSFDTDGTTPYTLVATRDVPLASSYVATIAAGVAPRYGNLTTEDEETEDVRTYGPLTYKDINFDTSDASRPLLSGNPTLAFANELDPTTIAGAFAIAPAAKTGYTLVQSDGSTGIRINPRALQPHTTYTVRVARTLKDRFGQKLASDVKATFTTGALAPDLWAPAGFSIFPSTMSVALDVATANLPKDRYRSRLRKLASTDVVSTDVSNPEDLDAVLGKDETWAATAAPSAPNRETTTPVALARTFGGPTGLLAYGVAGAYTLPGASETDQHVVGAVQVTNVGVFAQWFPSGGFVRAHRLSDGSPIAAASVEVYESKPAVAANPEPCATGKTDATGTATFTQSEFQRCLFAAKVDDTAPALVAIVHDGSDWSFVRTSPYYESLGDSYASWSAGLPHARGGFVSDRQLYQRGETAYFTGFGYFEVAGAIGIGSSKIYDVSVKSPQGKTISLGAHALDAFGSFDVHTVLPSDADLGDWSITATGVRGEAFAGTFTVAEFKPPTFKVSLAVDMPIVVGGDTVHATTTSAYLFGAPLAGGQEHVAVTRSQSSFTPKGYETFAYGPQYAYPERAPTLDSDVSESDVTTAADGKNSLAIPIATDLPFPADYRVDAEVKDVSNLAVGDFATFTALPSKSLIVLRGEYLGQANTSYGFDFAVVDPSGKLASGTAVHFTLARRVYDTATQVVEGSETPHDSVHYETVHEFDATSTDAVQRLQTTLAKGGEYRLRANIANAKSEATATDVLLYVVGEDAQWYRSDDTSLHVKLDKTLYKPGDTAHALIASPYPDSELLFAVIRNGAMQRRVLNVHGASADIPFTITPAMLPNVVVEAVLIRRGAPLSGAAATKVTDLSRAGFATVHVALDAKYVTVTAKPQNASVAPGGTQHVMLHVADAAGRPLRGEITVAVANDAVLQLSGYRFPDLVKQIYADLPISTRYADNRGDVKLASASEPVEKGFGYGGGAMAGPAGTRVRTKFRPIAFFDGSVRTDANGNATVSFTLPDDLTTWRILALARTTDARFGTTNATFIATKPLVTTPILPQFARPGDTLQAGVSVTDVSATKPGADAGDIDVSGTLSGPLAFAANTSSTQKTHFDGPTAGYRFAMLVHGTAPEATVKFLTTLGGASDAFEVPLPIVTDDVLESVVQTGTTQGAESVPLDVDASLARDAGGLHVTLASTLLGNTLAPLDAALANDGDPFAFENAARIAVASDRILLERRYGTTADVPTLLKRIAAEREQLRANARTDGSYAFFPQGPSDAFTTAFVAIQLVQAQHAGVDVAADLARIHTYLLAVLADPSRADAGCKTDLCKAETRLEALETLAPMGDVRSDHLSDIYQLRETMSYYERVELARHLVRLPEWAALGRNLRDELLQQVNETGRFAGLVQESDFGESQIDGESQLLSLMMETGIASDRIDRVFNTLLAARGRDGTWGCACDDAEAMNAIVQYAARDTVPPNFTATATIGSTGGMSFAQRFEGYHITQVTHDVAMSALPRGKSVVALNRGSGAGTLHYTVDFDYAIRGATAGAYQGIRIDRIVRPAGAAGGTAATAAPLASFGLAAPTQPLTIDAGQVFDIEDRITTDHPLEGLVVSDSLAAGLEAIDTRFATNATRVFESVADWNIDYQTIERNRVVTYASNVQPGVYAFHYLVRSVTPGTFSWPSAKASLALAPDEFGRTSAGTLVIK